jgi:Fe-S oxidoreductase
MPLPTATILGMLSDNLKRRGSVLPLSRRAATRWAKGLNLPRGGETVIYTGHMYQLIPAIEAMAGLLARFEGSRVTRLLGLGRSANRWVNLSAFAGLIASTEQRRESDRMLRNVATLLHRAGVSFGYLYGDEMYSGTLVYDQGLDGVFGPHARRVAETFRRHGVKRVITVDPHTTHMLREVYPRFVPGFDIEVRSYLDVLAEALPAPSAQAEGALVVHDSCVYARCEKVITPPRALLERAGLGILEPELCGAATHCCGGPIEVLFPAEAGRIARNRISQLEAAGPRMVTMCPICLVNLRKAAGAAEVDDISEVLAAAYGATP